MRVADPLRVGPNAQVRSTIPAFALLLALAAPARSQAAVAANGSAPIDAKSWRTHPRVVAIRSLVEANEAAIASGKWRAVKRTVCESRDRPFGREATVVRDGEGRIRKYVTVAGTDDSAYTIEHQYDERGRLRFAYARAGAFNGSEETYRLYFDEDGKELWRHHESRGPGYTFLRPPEFPDAWVVREPGKDLAAPKTCD